jgi:hypothetical protein
MIDGDHGGRLAGVLQKVTARRAVRCRAFCPDRGSGGRYWYWGDFALPAQHGARRFAQRGQAALDPRVPAAPAPDPQAIAVMGANGKHIVPGNADGAFECLIEQRTAGAALRQVQPQNESRPGHPERGRLYQEDCHPDQQ